MEVGAGCADPGVRYPYITIADTPEQPGADKVGRLGVVDAGDAWSADQLRLRYWLVGRQYADSIIMMKDGTIFAAGKPEEVMIEENIRSVYDVECRIIEDQGRPHVILRECDY